MTAGPKVVLLDLDGTLLDTWALHVRCLRRAVGGSAARIFAAQRPTDLGTVQALVGDEAAEYVLDAYHNELNAELATAAPVEMPGARELLEALRRVGTAAAVCTGRSRAGATALLAASGLGVDLVTAREDAARPKPSGDGVRHALARLGHRAEEALYVGDTDADLHEGMAAEVRTVLVRRGAWPDDVVVPWLGSLLQLIGV